MADFETQNHANSTGNKFTHIINKFLHYLSYVTVEPCVILYMFAFMTTSVVEQNFYLYKACTVNHGFSESVCNNLNNETYENITKEVQQTITDFHLWNNVAGHAVPIVLAMFTGAWSDKRGRKVPLLLGLIGKLYFSIMIIVNTIQTHWPVEYVIYTATLPMAFTGADVVIFASAFPYLVDITTPKSRTMRITIMEVFYLASMPSGIALGSYLYKNVLNYSYTSMFIVNASIMLAAVIYTALRLKRRSSPQQKPLEPGENFLTDFFDINHLLATVKAVCRKRSKNKRSYLILMIIMMALYVFQRDEREMMYYYCQLVFKWTVAQFSNFRTFQSALQDVILLIGVKLMSDVFNWRDTFIIMFGAAAHSAARIFYAAADDKVIFYAGGVFAAFGPVVAPVLRSMVSKIINADEKGKIFAMLAVADNAVPLISGICYSKLYYATIHFRPESIFYLTFATQVAVFLCVLYINFKTDRNEFEETEETRQLSSNVEKDVVCYKFEDNKQES